MAEEEAAGTKKKAATKKVAPKKAGDQNAPFRQLVRCHVKRRSLFNVTGGDRIEVFTDLNLKRSGKITYYEADKTHVMPLGHALDLATAKLVPRGSIARLPKDSDAKPTGIVGRCGEKPPVFEKHVVKPEDFEDAQAFDIDAIPEAEEWDGE